MHMTIGALNAALANQARANDIAALWTTRARQLEKELIELRGLLGADGKLDEQKIVAENARLTAENADLRGRNAMLREQQLANAAALSAAINSRHSGD